MLMDDFSKMLAHMPLDPEVHVKKSLFGTKSCNSGYVFGVHHALAYLTRDLTREQAIQKLEDYLEAHLIQFPYKPCSKKIRNDQQEIQPTAKGFAYLQDWFWIHCKQVSPDLHEQISQAIISPYNSLSLIRLERCSTGRIKLSTGLSILLWSRILGTCPNVFEFKDSSVVLSQADSSSNSSQKTMANSDYVLKRSNPLNPLGVSVDNIMNREHCDWDQIVSPYSRNQKHPNSTNISQYWNNNGVLFFKDLRFIQRPSSKLCSTSEYTIDYVLSGRALWQWIMDCTTAETKSEASAIARFLIHNGFLKIIEDFVVDALAIPSSTGGDLSASSLYRITYRGARLCPWEDFLSTEDYRDDVEAGIAKRCQPQSLSKNDNKTVTSPWDWESVTYPRAKMDEAFENCFNFRTINQDPGMRLLLREDLIRNHCRETLEFLDFSSIVIGYIKKKFPWKILITHIKDLKEIFLETTAPMQINISGETTKNLIELCDVAIAGIEKKTDNWSDSFIRCLDNARQYCEFLLNQSVISLSNHEFLEIPDFRQYIVSRYGSLPAPISMTEV